MSNRASLSSTELMHYGVLGKKYGLNDPYFDPSETTRMQENMRKRGARY